MEIGDLRRRRHGCRAHLLIKDAPSNLPNQDSTTSPPSGTLVGSHNAAVNIVGVQVRKSF